MLTKSRVVEGCIFVLSRANQMLQVEIEKRDILKKIYTWLPEKVY